MLHSSNHSRKYNLTRAGTRLARYLDYVESTASVSPTIHFADIPAIPEQFDDDRPQPEDGDTEDAETEGPPFQDFNDGTLPLGGAPTLEDMDDDDDDYGAHSPEED